MKDLILLLLITLLSIFSFIEFMAINNQQQKITELEKGVIYFSNETEILRKEQDRQAREIRQDLLIYKNGFEVGK